MKPFSKQELIGTAIILLFIGIFTFKNILIAERRARDAQRQADINQIVNGLQAFFDDYGFFPPSEDGHIKACRGDNFDSVVETIRASGEFDHELYLSGLAKCKWGGDAFIDLIDESTDPYLTAIPKDPKEEEGFSYNYISNQNRFQIYSTLEGREDEEVYHTGIFGRQLPCGKQICSFGKAYGETPLERSIEEYEQELLDLQRQQLVK